MKKTETVDILKDTSSKTLDIKNFQIERAHRAGDKINSTCRKIAVKFPRFKMKECILEEDKKKNPRDIWISQNFSKEIVKICKEKWEKVKYLRLKSKYVFFNKNIFCKKMSFKNPSTLRKC